MSTEAGKIFNVNESKGPESETTAAQALAQAPSFKASRQVEENAEKEQEAAAQAAAVAKTLGTRYTGEPSTAVDIPRAGDMASQKTNEAVEEGKKDVDNAKQVAGGYVQEAKDAASKVTTAAQDYLASINGDQTVTGTRSVDPQTTNETNTRGYVSTLQNTAAAVVNTASTYLASAKDTAQPHVERVIAAAQNALGTAGTQGAQVHDIPTSSTGNLDVSGGQGTKPSNSLSGIPSTSAPLESGKKTFNSPYASTTTKVGTENLKQDEANLKSKPVN